MAEPTLRLPQNIVGAFYVTDECIDCDQCRDLAPASFRRHDEINYSVVYHQPVTPAERAAAEDALVSCPVDAIGEENT